MALTAMPTAGEHELLKARIERELARGGYGPWETRFLQDIRAKLCRARPRLTERQVLKIHDVLSRSQLSRQPRLGARHGRPHGQYRLPWPLRSLGFRRRRDLALALVLAVVFGLHQLIPGLFLQSACR